jgi:Zn-dependent protease with chaperone function
VIQINAAYYDGRSSSRRDVKLSVEESGRVTLRGEGIKLDFEYPQLRVSSRLGNTPRYIHLPGGGKIETADNDGVDEIVETLGGYEANRFLHGLESRYRYALAALLLTVGVTWATITYGIPLLATQVAFALPQNVEESLGRDGLKILDRGMFQPTGLSEAELRRLRGIFASLSAWEAISDGMTLELRRSPRLGANAFALPSGIVVLTDELVGIAENDEELLAVMAHEAGHVQHRHISRQILQNSMTALLVAGVFGDLSSIAGLSATLPTFLIEQRYSRKFEMEADQFAVKFMDSRNIPLVHLTNILQRLSLERPGAEGEVVDYLSSHPATDERIEALESRSER